VRMTGADMHERTSQTRDAALEHLPAIAYVAEVHESGRTSFLFVSGRTEEITGFRADEYGSGAQDWRDRIHPDDLPRFEQEYRRTCVELAPLRITYRSRRRDGRWVWLEDRASAERDPDRRVTAISGIVLDVTAHHAEDDAAARARQSLQRIASHLREDLDESLLELAEREANYRSLFESVDDMVLVCDTDGRIIEANPAATHMTGYELPELRGMHILDLHPEDVRDEAGRIVGEMLAGRASKCPLPLLSADGSSIPTETRVWHGSWNGQPCIFGISRDLVAEREATERFDRLFHASPALMAVSTFGEGAAFVEVNDAWLQATGYSREDVIGRTSADLGLFPDPEGQRALAAELRETGRLHNARLRVRTKDGRLLDGVFAGQLIKSQGTSYFLTVMVDDTERQKAESEQLELNRRLEAANRELHGFVHSIAHDLRTPLRTIGSFAQILEAEHCAELTDDACDAIRRIVRANGRMERLIDALLDLSGLTHRPLREEPVDISRVAAEVVEYLRDAEPSRVVEVVVEPGMQVDADPSLIRILLENLLGNAWKFTRRREIAHVEVGRTDAGGETVYFVRDDGVGFDPQYSDRLFSAFERLHDETEFPGTGIGLATVQRIVERHGGRAWAEGAVGEGATFYFTFAGDD
jgi:PAS domain S-box-containing protein